MVKQRQAELDYPTLEDVEDFHDIIIKQRGTSGYNSRGLIGIGLEWAEYTITNYFASPGLIQRAGAMLYAYVMFHPYADGNKRTALLTTDFFLFLNDYNFVITEDAPDFARSFYLNCIDPKHSTLDLIQMACTWLRPRTVPFSSGVRRGVLEVMLKVGPTSEVIMEVWLERTVKQFEAFAKKNGRPTTVNASSRPTPS